MKPLWILAAVLSFAVSPALADDVPTELAGKWAEGGACDDADKSITIADNTLAFGDNEPAEIYFAPDESPSGNGAIHWAEEGNVDNFEYDPVQDKFLYNAEGWGMGIAPVLYERCK